MTKESKSFEIEEPFYVFEVEDVVLKHKKWTQLLPNVIPYYALKANRFPLLLDLLIGLKVRFDCASKHEMEQVLRRGALPDHIILAHPVKSLATLLYAKTHSITRMTFDCRSELEKVCDIYPSAELILRIKVEDSNSSLPLSKKFGIDINECEALLRSAKDMGMRVSGVAFHVGSGCLSPVSYSRAIRSARIVYDMALEIGFKFNIVDIGGGFPGTLESHLFDDIAQAINETLAQEFRHQEVQFIAEPGRFFCETAFSLVTTVLAVKKSDEPQYYINDGIYGSFLDRVVDKRLFEPKVLKYDYIENEHDDLILSALWGPTCCSHDFLGLHLLPQLEVGARLLFQSMGAYCLPNAEFGFNGIQAPKVLTKMNDKIEDVLRQKESLERVVQTIQDDNYRMG